MATACGSQSNHRAARKSARCQRLVPTGCSEVVHRTWTTGPFRDVGQSGQGEPRCVAVCGRVAALFPARVLYPERRSMRRPPSEELVLVEEPGFEPAVAPAFAPRSRFGRYELLGPIARGGVAEVWLARSRGALRFVRKVAIKTPLPGLARRPEVLRMFAFEALIAGRMSHPHLVQVFDVDQ